MKKRLATVTAIDANVINGALDALRTHDPLEMRGCCAVSVDRNGAYYYSTCGMTPEQMLAAAECLRTVALDEILERD